MLGDDENVITVVVMSHSYHDNQVDVTLCIMSIPWSSNKLTVFVAWFIPKGSWLVSQQTVVINAQMQVVLHCKHEVFKLYLLHCIADSGFVHAVFTVVAVLLFAHYHNMPIYSR